VSGVKSRNSRKSLFERLEIPAPPCEYIFSLILFIINNQVHFKSNSDIHTVSTGTRISFIDQLPTSHVFKSAYYADIKIFNSLPSNLTNEKEKFKVALRYT
jgi:hypothetical protein